MKRSRLKMEAIFRVMLSPFSLGSQDQRPLFHFPTHLASRKFTEKFGGAVGLAKMEVGWCGEHADLSPAVLSGNEGLEGPPVFRICVQGPSRHGDSAEKAFFAFLLSIFGCN